MKRFNIPFVFLLVGMGLNSAYAQPVKFNHGDVQVGKILESCYHNPCSGAKVVGFRQLAQSSNSATLELTLLGYSRDWNSKKKEWNKQKYKVFVVCSISNPTVTIDEQVTVLPINTEMAIPGVQQSDYNIYVSACHGGYIDETKLAKKYGYNVTDW